MTQYIGVLLTKDGYFCVSPAWDVKEGDLVGLPNALGGADRVCEVRAVVTDEKDGQYLAMLEKFVGYPLPRITARYKRYGVEWNEPVQE